MMKLHTDARERKTRRLQLVVRPSLYAGLESLKEKSGLSINEIVNQVLEEHVPELVEEYGREEPGDQKFGGHIT